MFRFEDTDKSTPIYMTFRFTEDTLFGGVLIGVNIEKLEIVDTQLHFEFDVLDAGDHKLDPNDLKLAEAVAKVILHIINVATSGEKEL